MIVIVIQNIISVFLEIISYHYLFSKIGCVIKPLFLYLINRFDL